ncbi:MAG: hypothetical protein M5U19_09930 [Microthrixaceae bacterium]|nr:hypothetical protein [Microthrixaceae bacterium]
MDPDEVLPDVLLKMRRARRHVAVVSGGADAPIGGLVTMEDIPEAIVGDITDESDKPTGEPRHWRQPGWS